ncbi:MAG: tetratricopeptide repeat protein [Candidatus Nanoarchaeia archaeon]|nr:tetratricopeptide repeat protein [Candidatus Nanoarchaeia archaeon]
MGISLCMVVKNEGKNLPEFFDNIKELVDEIILVDTGSDDDTIEIAEKYKCTIFKIEQRENWIIEARNLSLEKASKEWILVLDADERISKKDFERLKKLSENEEFTGYYLIQRQYTNKIGEAGWISSKNDSYEESKIANGWHENPILRFFKNDKRIRYEGMPHDIVDKSVKKIGKTCLTDIPIHHFGDMNREEQNKPERNIKFLQRTLEGESEERYFILFQLASELLGKGQIEEAIEHLEESLKLNPDYYLTFLNLGGAYIKLKRVDDAERILLRALKIKQTSEVYNNLGIIYSERNELNRALKKFEKALELNPNSADAYFNIGIIYLKNGKEKTSIPYFKKAIELNPGYANKVRLS